VVIDPTGRLNGRGAYLCRDAACWTAGLRKGTLDRALGTTIPAGLRAQLAAGPDANDSTTATGSHEEPLTTTTTGGGAHG
jgi:predicted RNA-binding protein YlxR (DUF448 family)